MSTWHRAFMRALEILHWGMAASAVGGLAVGGCLLWAGAHRWGYGLLGGGLVLVAGVFVVGAFRSGWDEQEATA